MRGGLAIQSPPSWVKVTFSAEEVKETRNIVPERKRVVSGKDHLCSDRRQGRLVVDSAIATHAKSAPGSGPPQVEHWHAWKAIDF